MTYTLEITADRIVFRVDEMAYDVWPWRVGEVVRLERVGRVHQGVHRGLEGRLTNTDESARMGRIRSSMKR
jgi:hypothetical protein